MSKLKTRLISACVGAVFVLGAIFSSPKNFHLVLAAACFIMLHELRRTFGQEKKWLLAFLQYAFGVMLLVIPFAQGTAFETVFALQPILTLYTLVLLSVAVVRHDSIKLTDVTRSLFMMIYAVLLPMHLTFIRLLEAGEALIFLPFLGAWMPDTFAYFAGSLFGRHKLIPSVSPKKTVEGSIGAVVGAVLMFLLYGYILSVGFDYQVNYLWLTLLALICGVVAQVGDLAASVIKRECDIKDFGNIIPGHGGVLDRTDSLLFVAPVIYYFLLLFEVVYK